MKKYAFVIALIVILTAAFVLPSFAQAPAGQKIIRWAYSMPSKKSYSPGWEQIGPEFEKATNGRYKIEYYPGETLFKMAAAFDSVVSGVAQVACVSTGTFEKRLLLSQVATMPTLDFPGELNARIAVGRAFMEMYNRSPNLQEEYKGVKLFGYHQNNPYILISRRKEISLPEHFKGLKVGGTGTRMRMISNHGGADVNQVPPDAYMNLDKGVVDACFVSWSQVYDYKLNETAKYFYDFSFGGGAFAMCMNEAFWKGMSPEDQKIFMELWEKGYEVGVKHSWSEVEKGQKVVAESKLTVKTPTPEEIVVWRKAAGPVIDFWLKSAKENNAKNPEGILAAWQQALADYK